MLLEFAGINQHADRAAFEKMAFPVTVSEPCRDAGGTEAVQQGVDQDSVGGVERDNILLRGLRAADDIAGAALVNPDARQIPLPMALIPLASVPIRLPVMVAGGVKFDDP